MANIPGVRFDITGASGSQGLLGPKSGWKTYVLPRGGYAAQDSTGALITFDSSIVASRFSANQWIQVGLLTSNIRQVSAVGGNSISVSGIVTVTENDRVFLIGNTQPTINGGSATYTVPNTIIRQRDDDGSDIYTNSMVTSNSNGLIQFFAVPAIYDCLVQDGNQTLQGSIIDVEVGTVEGVSTGTDSPSIFGSTVTINAALGVTGWAFFGSSVTMHAALGVSGIATFGTSVVFNGAIGVTGKATFGNSVLIQGALGVTGLATLSGGAVIAGGVTISGTLNFPVGGITTSALAANAVLKILGVSNSASDTAITTAWAQISGMSIGLIPASSSSVLHVQAVIPFAAYDIAGGGADGTVQSALLEFYGPAAIGVTIHQCEWGWRDLAGASQSGHVALLAVRQGYTQTVSYRAYALTSVATFGVTVSGTTPRQPVMSLFELKK